jgi:hypothetical protein
MVKLRPTEPASPDVDPLELGKEALHLLDRMQLQGAYQLAVREQVGELVRQLLGGLGAERGLPVVCPMIMRWGSGPGCETGTEQHG